MDTSNSTEVKTTEDPKASEPSSSSIPPPINNNNTPSSTVNNSTSNEPVAAATTDVKMAGQPETPPPASAAAAKPKPSPSSAAKPKADPPVPAKTPSSSNASSSGKQSEKTASASKPSSTSSSMNKPTTPKSSTAKEKEGSSKEASSFSVSQAKPAPTTSSSATASSAKKSEKEKVKKESSSSNAEGDLAGGARSSTSKTASASDKPEKRRREKKKSGAKKRKPESGGASSSGGGRRSDGSQDDDGDADAPKKPGPKKGKKKKVEDGTKVRKKKSKNDGLTRAQAAVNDMMRQLLEEDKYSVQGSIVDTDSSDDEEDERAIYAISGGASGSKRGAFSESEATLITLNRAVVSRAARKRLRIEGMRGVMDTTGSRKRANSIVIVEDKDTGKALSPLGGGAESGDDSSAGRGGRKKKRKKVKRGGRVDEIGECIIANDRDSPTAMDASPELGSGVDMGDDLQGTSMDESSIFGQTTGSSNATWVECDKCKKWRRLRGIVDAKKLPPKWYCTMNKNDPERAKCSAPEEEYETPVTPETLTDQRARKHLRLWVRRLQCIESYESRLPTMTRGKRRNTTNAKDPYEWVRCCNPSCGKWRAVLRSMDAASVIDAAKNGEWYCVLNTWDEKTASCAAPQENLPAIGCPPWVLQNEE